MNVAASLWRVVKGLGLFFGVAFLLLVVVSVIGSWFLEALIALVFGWIRFLRDNVLALDPNPLRIVEAVVSIAALAVGGHYGLRWLHAQVSPGAAQPWRRRWTAAALGGVLLLFVAGVATIGITHQTAWLFTSNQPMVESDAARWRLSTVLIGTQPYVERVGETWKRTGRLPESDAEAGAPAFASPNEDVRLIAIGRGGAVTIYLGPRIAEGGVVVRTPEPRDGELQWTCRSNLRDRYLPASCRGP